MKILQNILNIPIKWLKREYSHFQTKFNENNSAQVTLILRSVYHQIFELIIICDGRRLHKAYLSKRAATTRPFYFIL